MKDRAALVERAKKTGEVIPDEDPEKPWLKWKYVKLSEDDYWQGVAKYYYHDGCYWAWVMIIDEQEYLAAKNATR